MEASSHRVLPIIEIKPQYFPRGNGKVKDEFQTLSPSVRIRGQGRIIIHCDLDALFASVEILHHGFPEDEPLIIGSDPMQGRGRGIVSTCNYAAREYGVRSAMPISEVRRRCPGHPFGPARFIRGTRSLYSMLPSRA